MTEVYLLPLYYFDSLIKTPIYTYTRIVFSVFAYFEKVNTIILYEINNIVIYCYG